jgi:hypothetical protein
MARYQVTREPGAPIEGVGLVPAGRDFVAPADYVPQSATFLPLDAEALAAMQKKFPDKKFVIGEPAAAPKTGPEEPLTAAQSAERYASRPPPKRV